MQDENKKPGRPRLIKDQDYPLDNYNARLSAWHARVARKIGDGNLSSGIRKAIEYMVEKKK
jgi:hypothetical protein